jgi:hypothetical protein
VPHRQQATVLPFPGPFHVCSIGNVGSFPRYLSGNCMIDPFELDEPAFVVAALIILSGINVAVRMLETRQSYCPLSTQNGHWR